MEKRSLSDNRAGCSLAALPTAISVNGAAPGPDDIAIVAAGSLLLAITADNSFFVPVFAVETVIAVLMVIRIASDQRRISRNQD